MQPCSQPRYGFTARSKPISGELFQVIDRARRIADQRGRQRRQVGEFGGERVPAVIEWAGGPRIKPHRRIGRGAATMAGQARHCFNRRRLGFPATIDRIEFG